VTYAEDLGCVVILFGMDKVLFSTGESNLQSSISQLVKRSRMAMWVCFLASLGVALSYLLK